MEKHSSYIFLLSFLVITIQTFSKPYFVFCLLATLILLIYYWVKFKLSELLPGILITLILLATFKFLSPLENPHKVIWITESKGDETLAVLSNKSKVPVGSHVRIGDTVDDRGNVVYRGNSLLYLFPNLRMKVYRHLEENIAYPVSSVAGGVTLGVRRDIPDAVKGYFLLSGLYPLLAISGLHVGIVIGVIAFIFGLFSLKKPLTKASLTVLPLMPLTGLPPSAVRAYLFTLFISVGIERFRKVSPFYLLGVILFVTALTGKLSVGAVLSFLAVGGILVVVDSIKSRTLKWLLFPIAPVMFTLPIVLSAFGTFNPASVINYQIASVIFAPFLVLTFLSEVTLFKVTIINRLVELIGIMFIRIAQELFLFTKDFVFYSRVPLYLSGVVLLLMLIFLLSRKKFLSFLPPACLLIWVFLSPTTVTNKTFTVDAYKLNSFHFLSMKGQSYRNCAIHSQYVFPYTRKFLFRNKLIDKRDIISPNSKEVRK